MPHSPLPHPPASPARAADPPNATPNAPSTAMPPTAGPARQGSIREANLALLYRLILDAPAPVSRAALAGSTGMTRATASALADALLAAGLVEEVSPRPATSAGRPAAGLVAATSGAAGLGVEVNVDYLAACVVDLAGTVRHQTVRHQDQRGRAVGETLADVAALAREAATAAAGLGLTPAGVSVAVPGLVSAGRVRRAPNLGWRDVEVISALTSAAATGPPATPLGISVGNEADYAALAELEVRRRSPDPDDALSDFLYVSGEIGVGAGIVLDRALFTGARGWAGEIGHVTVEPGGALCRCGAHGCLETVAGLESLTARSGPDVLDRAAAGLGRAVAAALNLLDLPHVVLGGVYARPDLAPQVVPAVQAALAEHVVSADWSPVTVHASRLGETAAAHGAALAVVRRVHADPADWIARVS